MNFTNAVSQQIALSTRHLLLKKSKLSVTVNSRSLLRTNSYAEFKHSDRSDDEKIYLSKAAGWESNEIKLSNINDTTHLVLSLLQDVSKEVIKLAICKSMEEHIVESKKYL